MAHDTRTTCLCELLEHILGIAFDGTRHAHDLPLRQAIMRWADLLLMVLLGASPVSQVGGLPGASGCLPLPPGASPVPLLCLPLQVENYTVKRFSES